MKPLKPMKYTFYFGFHQGEPHSPDPVDKAEFIKIITILPTRAAKLLRAVTEVFSTLLRRSNT